MNPRSPVTYTYINSIKRTGTRSQRMDKFEGCIRRIMTDIMHKPPMNKRQRDKYEFLFMSIERNVRDMYKAEQ